MQRDQLREVNPKEAFWCANNVTVTNAQDLLDAIRSMDEKTFFTHVRKDGDDFAAWLHSAVGATGLSEHLALIKEKKKYERTFQRLLRHVQREQQHPFLFHRVRLAFHILRNISLILFIVLSVSLLLQNLSLHQDIKQQQEQYLLLSSQIHALGDYFEQSAAKTVPTENQSSDASLSFTKKNISPPDHFSIDLLRLNRNAFEIRTLNKTYFIGIIGNTSSMLPVLSEQSQTLEFVPTSPQDITVGSLISYTYENGVIIHRVILVGQDEEGWFALTMGDNNPQPDPKQVRFPQIRGVVVAIIY